MPNLGVYLIRHENALRDAIGGDVNRGLSAGGRQRMARTARFIAEQADLHIDHIWHSPLVRAVQTAELLAAGIGLDAPIVALPSVARPTTLERLAEAIVAVDAPVRGVAVVGHEPTLSVLAGALLGPQFERSWRGFDPGQVVAMQHDRTQMTWSFGFTIEPDGPRRIDTIGA